MSACVINNLCVYNVCYISIYIYIYIVLFIYSYTKITTFLCRITFQATTPCHNSMSSRVCRTNTAFCIQSRMLHPRVHTYACLHVHTQLYLCAPCCYTEFILNGHSLEEYIICLYRYITIRVSIVLIYTAIPEHLKGLRIFHTVQEHLESLMETNNVEPTSSSVGWTRPRASTASDHP